MNNKSILVLLCLSLILSCNGNYQNHIHDVDKTNINKCKKLYNNNKYSEAKEYCEKAVYQGNIDANFYLGYMYYKGLGVQQNYQKTMMLWEKSANQSDYFAQNNLGSMYYKGQRSTSKLSKSHRVV